MAVRAVVALADVPPPLRKLRQHLDSLEAAGGLRDRNLGKARVAVLVELGRNKEALAETLSPGTVADIEGRLDQIAAALEQRNVLLLTNGALEHHLPSYVGDIFRLGESAKRNAADAEAAILATGLTGAEIEDRYGGLYRAIRKLPGKEPVEVDSVLEGVSGAATSSNSKSLAQAPGLDRRGFQGVPHAARGGQGQALRH